MVVLIQILILVQLVNMEQQGQEIQVREIQVVFLQELRQE